MSWDSQFSVALPYGAVGQSGVCDCGIPDHTHLFFIQFIIKYNCQIISKPSQSKRREEGKDKESIQSSTILDLEHQLRL